MERGMYLFVHVKSTFSFKADLPRIATISITFKGIVHPKITFLSSFNYPAVVPVVQLFDY